MEKLCNLNKVRFPQTGYLIQVFFVLKFWPFQKKTMLTAKKIALFFQNDFSPQMLGRID